MKKISVLILLLPLFSSVQKVQHTYRMGGGGVHFLENLSWQQVKERAKAEHKYIFVDCFATWCGPCKAMDKITYLNDSVGEIMNHAFLSVKVQCDTSKSDGEDVVSQYSDAHQIIADFHVTAYPTFLFFTPDGKIVHKGLGFLDPARFVALAREAVDPSKQYVTLINEYHNGHMDYARMPYLADKANRLKDTGLFSSIAKQYINGYLDRLSDSAFCKKENFKLLQNYSGSLNSTDRVFGWLIKHPEVGDSIMLQKGFSSGMANFVIYKEEITPSLEMAKKSGNSPDWEPINQHITAKFGKEHAEKVVLKGKMRWYEFKKDWENYCGVAIERIEKGDFKNNPGNPGNLDILNSFAYAIFQLSNDKNKLEKALSWSELTTGVITDSSVHAGDIMDTKAELLYKLGRREEALILEAKASKIAPDREYIREALQKMQEGKSTW